MFNFSALTSKEAIKLLDEVGGYSSVDHLDFSIVKLYDIEYDRYEETTKYDHKIVYFEKEHGMWLRTSLFTTVDKTGRVIEIEINDCTDNELGHILEQDAINSCNYVNFED